jgi:hypothetical protein
VQGFLIALPVFGAHDHEIGAIAACHAEGGVPTHYLFYE